MAKKNTLHLIVGTQMIAGFTYPAFACETKKVGAQGTDNLAHITCDSCVRAFWGNEFSTTSGFSAFTSSLFLGVIERRIKDDYQVQYARKSLDEEIARVESLLKKAAEYVSSERRHLTNVTQMIAGFQTSASIAGKVLQYATGYVSNNIHHSSLVQYAAKLDIQIDRVVQHVRNEGLIVEETR